MASIDPSLISGSGLSSSSATANKLSVAASSKNLGTASAESQMLDSFDVPLITNLNLGAEARKMNNQTMSEGTSQTTLELTSQATREPTLQATFLPNSQATRLPNSQATSLATSQTPTQMTSLPLLDLATQSSTHSSETSKKKRPRRTKEQMRVFRGEKAWIKRLKAAKKGSARSKKSGRSQSSTSCRGRQSQTGSALQSQNTKILVVDSNPPFVLEDYSNICAYLKDEKNYQQLYGSGSKTSIGPTQISKTAAYESFAIFMNSRSDRGLHLTGKQLRLRIDTYKKKFTKTKEWAENTGAGIEERDGASTLAEKLERMCPCYERMYGIFAAKHNVTPLRTYDSIDGIGAMVSSRSSGSEDDEGTETDDLTEGPEDILEGQRSLEEPHKGSEEMQDLHDSANQSQNYPTNHHASASGVDVEINLLGND
ncbi:hypothetical protein PCASD_15528 [Puccinia coronata f. sp. avenae]|uniref:Uncharacterized protein n=1 Tax=Puccinia coronata f. sp. avenae TaxID=200324 RepID=A0A2N5U6D8_9BASI|nr:hypothetical protein PCASD_15528 [Puccinia coronata f. sp. avenae]